MEIQFTKRPLDELVKPVNELFPKLTLDEQRISVALYRLAMQGSRVVGILAADHGHYRGGLSFHGPGVSLL